MEYLEVEVEVELNNREVEGQRKENHWLTDILLQVAVAFFSSPWSEFLLPL